MKQHILKTESNLSRRSSSSHNKKNKNIEAIYPLSPMQQGLLFHSTLDPDSGAYIEQLECTLEGGLDVEAFQRAWQKVVDRHAVLRTGFFSKGLDKPVQIVSRRLAVALESQDWRDLLPEEQEHRWENLLNDDRRRGFELSKPPLMRLLLTRTADDCYRFLWSHHHILLDGWSLALVLKEVLTCYEAFANGRDVQLQTPRPYRDYIAWLQRQDIAQAKAYWRRELAGFRAPTLLTVDRDLSDQPAGYAEKAIELSGEITAELQALAPTYQLTLNTLVQGAWALLLSRYSGEQEIVFGVTASGRPTELGGLEAMVGLFINTLPVRVQVPLDACLLDWLQALQALNVTFRQYDYAPLADIQRWSDIRAGQPLFQSIFAFENYPVDAALRGQKLGDVKIGDLRLHEQTNYPLALVVMPSATLSLRISYDRQRFDAATINRLLGQLRTLLEGMVANLEAQLSELPLLTQEERRQLLIDWNATKTDFPKDRCIHQLFEAQVEKTPEATAIVFEDQSLTYAELNARANQLAHHLRALGVGPDVLVGICVERSLEMIVGLLGILKAGGAYVPLDPDYPQERLVFMFEDTQAPVLVTQAALLEALPTNLAEVVCLDRDWETTSHHSERNPDNATQPEHLAYVMYTSGSTGTPKGTSIAHRGVVRLVKETNYASLTAEEVFLQFAPISFDASTLEIWGSLLTGGRLVVFPPHTPSFAELGQTVRETGITTLWLTAGLFHLMVDQQPEDLRHVRQLLAGGDVLSLPHVQKLLKGREHGRLINGYGPTENTTFTCCHTMTADSEFAGSIPIGRPIANTEIYILDAELNPVPIGVPGELYIGGAGLARGYLNRPDLTAEKFIPNPFSDTPGARLYATGDLARYLPDGNIEFLGRIDHQVKIRGFRIELGEIESTLAQHPLVREAVVMAREDSLVAKRLVAYIALTPDAELDISVLRGFLKDKLPDYMIPAAFVKLDALPLTPNGKVDRKALPSPEGRLELGQEYVAPRTPIEEVLAQIWAEVLRVERVGIHDNFFELGGHSLLATQVISRIRDPFRVELPLRELFEAPTVAGLAKAIERARLDSKDLHAPAIQRVARESDLPLSFSQQRLWFLDRLEPDSPFYNIPMAVRLQGALDVAALGRSLNAIIKRHEALRTTFRSVDGQAVQVIAPTLDLELPVFDLRSLPESERVERAQELAIEEAKASFDLVHGPLVRVRLLRLGDEDHVLQVTIHHIVADGWSIGVFVDELAYFYRSFAVGQPSPLPPLAIQYADFAYWQRQWFQGEVLEKQLAYWKEQLKDLPRVLELPTDQPRPAVQTFHGAHHPIVVFPELTQALRALSHESGATLFMTLLAAFQVLLYRYTNQKDFAVGSPIANRNRAETEGLIGFFVNTLVLRTDFSANPTFRELVVHTKETTLGAYVHQDLPFERLVDELQPERDMSHSPLFQVMFVLQNAPLHSLDMPGLKLTPWELEPGVAKFDLTLDLAEEGEGLKGSFEYNTDLFDPTTIARLSGHFITLLEGIAQAPNTQVSQLPLLTAAERQRLLVDWNVTEAKYPHDRCIHELFEGQVEKTPEATAVVFEDQSLTYAELNARANQLAHHLRNLGVGPDVLVAICVERSLEMIVGLLGILKAGGAYVPLDPDYPKDRLAFMLEDTQAPVLVTQATLVETLPVSHAQVVCLDRAWSTIGRQSEANPTNQAASEHRAYVIHTSGSTGKPKGIQISHRAVVNFLFSMGRRPGIRQNDIVLAVTTLSFDISTLEIFLPLVMGAQTVIVSREVAQDGNRLLEVLRNSEASLMQATPATWRLLLEAGWQGTKSLKVLCGGEPLSRELTNQVHQRAPALWNMYGPTETTVWSSVSPVESERVPVSIGPPIANTEIYILDAELNPVPIGVPGELYIGGAGLARGYLNRPDLTAEKFIPNPFSEVPGERLYKTGDLARYLPDGNIEFLGRIDHQVKIRGFRIELGEIESTLVQHLAVREAVVIAREDRPGDKRLVGYMVPASDAELDVSALRAFLKDKLPDYMVPPVFVKLDALPLTPNGKVDRKALPVPEGRLELLQEYVAPRTPTEVVLAGIWAAVLGVERVGIHDNFFELGGHSLLGTQVISRIRGPLQVELLLRELFEAPTVAGLAKAIERTRLDSKDLRAPAIQLVSRDGDLPLSFAQQRLWFLDRLEPDSPFYNIPMAVRLQGALEVALERSLNAIIERHEALRTTFHSVDGQAVQMIAPTLDLELPVFDLRSLPESERVERAQELAVEEAKAPFDLARGPLVRARLLRLGDEDHILQVTLHHIVADGWSIGVFVDELTYLYRSFAAGQSSPLPPLAIQYADFAHWQRQWFQGEVLEKQLAYWREQLKDLPPVLELPTDRPRPAVQTFHGAHHPVVISPELTQALRALSHESGATLFMTLLAAFQVLLYRYTNQNDFAVGSPIANRNRAETEGLIGFFVNTLVLRADFSANPTFRELVVRTKETTLGAYAHQDLPFERLVDELQPERDMSHTPLFQVMFALQNALLHSLDMPGLKLTPWELEFGVAKFDLTLDLAEEGEGLRGSFEYNTDLFDPTTIARLSGHFITLLEGIAQAPNAQVSQLPLLTAAERQRLLVDWNATETDFPKDQCIHQLFEAQVEKTPEATAVVFEDQSLTYAELNARANQLAHYLRGLGVGPDVLVGICVERSLEMIVGLLGILKAGGAYVPLDPDYPKDRLAFILGDTQAPVLVTQESLLDMLSANCAEIVCLNRERRRIEQQSKKNPANKAQPKCLAYVIYTSGSTGRPKGVMIAHGSLSRHCQTIKQRYEITPADHILQYASFNFDVSLEQLLSPLIVGAWVVLRGNEPWDPVELIKKITDFELTILDLTPVYWRQVVHELTNGSRDWENHLRLVIVGGDVLLPDCPTLGSERSGEAVRVINAYGPTEATITTNIFEVFPECLRDGHFQFVPIGRPTAQSQAYILDAELNPVPIGVGGELYIGGTGLARGYLNRAALTAEKFIPNPFTEAGERLYKTGDLARYLPDGNIEFLGRIDHQVKIRGFRIELGEIESTLAQHPAVREVAVVASEEDCPGDKRLVAYIVSTPHAESDVSALRAFLKAKLPDYMMPAAFVFLDALPLTLNGKVDRRALPAPEGRPKLDQGYVAPDTPAEELLASIWAELLRIDQVGIYDNFFELGGDSILSIQIVARANQAGVRLTPRQLFEHQTVAELAAVAGSAPLIQAEQDIVTGRAPLTPIQHEYLQANFPAPHHYNQSVLLEVRETLEPKLLESAIQHLLEHHDALRIRFVRVGPSWEQVNAEREAQAVFTHFNLSSYSASEQLAALETTAAQLQTSLDLTSGPLIRVALFSLGGNRRDRLLLIIHHLVVDGVSWRILLEDLQTVYRHIQAGQRVTLPEKTTSFKQWAERLQAFAQSERAHEELHFWLSIGREPIGPLPIDNPRGANTVATARTATVSLTAQETQALLQDAPAAYGTQINDLLLAALAQTVSNWTEAEALWVDLEGHGREPLFDDLDLTRTIGWFTTIFPVRLDLTGTVGAGAAIKAVKEQLRLVPRKGLGYGALRYLTDNGRALAAVPRPEISFNYLGQFDQIISGNALFRPAREKCGPERSAQQSREHLFDINASITGGELQIAWSYSAEQFFSETVQRLADRFIADLRGLIAHCLASLTSKRGLSIRERYLSKPDWSPLVPFNPGGKSRPLFCVPGREGTVLCFQALVRRLDREQSFYGLEARGVNGDQEPHRSVEEMASCYVRAIKKVQAEGPFLLGGYSFGAHVAFEMALQLQRRGNQVERLLILDDAAPFRDTFEEKELDETRLLTRAFDLIGRLSDKEVKLSAKKFATLSDEARFVYLKEHLERCKVLVPAGGEEMVWGLINVLRATTQMGYSPQDVYDGDIVLFRTREGRSEDRGLAQNSAISQDPAWGWQEFCTGRVQVHWVPGDHTTMLMEPHVKTLSERMQTQFNHIGVAINERFCESQNDDAEIPIWRL